VVPHAVGLAAQNGEAVSVTGDGRILVRGEARSINDLQGAVTDRSSPPRLEADHDAPWMHVQWVMAALGELGFETALCVVEVADSDERGTVMVPVYRGLWEDKWNEWRTPEERALRVCVLPLEGEPSKAQYRLEADDTLSHEVTRDPARVAAWAISFLGALDPEQTAKIALEASGAVAYGFVIAALAALQDAGVSRVDVGLEALHPWDRDRRILPPPGSGSPILRWAPLTDVVRRLLVPMNLPVASMSLQDRDDDPDDRVIVNLTATGRLVCADKALTLEEFSGYLQQQADAYDRKMQTLGKEGREDVGAERPWSKLYVLLRVDRDAPWEHVRWLLAELSARGFYKIQFAAGRGTLPACSQEELERQWAGQDISGPVATLDRKLYCFQPVSIDPVVDCEVSIRGSPARYEFAERSTQDPAELASWLRGAPRDRTGKDLGRIDADRHTRFGDVVSAINAFHMAGLEKTAFAGVERAPPGVYRMERFPRPE
jgi:biopolymer transport protein ExbD